MDGLRIDSASLGIPVAGRAQVATVERLCREIAEARLAIRPSAGARTLVADVRPIVEIAHATGVALEACVFVGSSTVRRLAEDWDLEQIVGRTRESVRFAASEGLAVTFITEDTTRSSPGELRPLLLAALEAGAGRLCLCDTVGSATPEAAFNLVTWVRAFLSEHGFAAGLDWHGHQDRGLALANTLAAVAAGADRVHATALGLGERVGNTATEQLLVNLSLLGLSDRELTGLPDYVALAARAFGVPVPQAAPVVGRDAFRTATGVHAAAVVKAWERGLFELAERVYSAIPARSVGRKLAIDIGPMSGASNVRGYLLPRGLDARPDAAAGLLERAARAGRVLTDEEIDDFLGTRAPEDRTR
jgi:2-isopropylmalate synthase